MMLYKKIGWIVLSLTSCSSSSSSLVAATSNTLRSSATTSLPEDGVDRKYTPDDLLNVALGVFEGFLQHDIDLARTCMVDTMDTMSQIEIAIADLEKGTPDSVQKGVEELGEAFEDFIDNGLKDCKLYAADVDTVTKAFGMISHPLQFLYHAGTNFAVNRVEIGKEIRAAIIDWRSDPPHFMDFGMNVGEAARLVLVGNTTTTTTTAVFDSEVEVW